MSKQSEKLLLSFIGGGILVALIFWLALTQSKVTYPKVSEVSAPKKTSAASKVIPPESSTAPTNKGSGSRYRGEIIKYIIDPCLAQIARKNLTGLMSEKQAVDLLKITDKGSIENLIKVTLPVIEGATLSERKKLYKFGLSRCVEAGSKQPISGR